MGEQTNVNAKRLLAMRRKTVSTSLGLDIPLRIIEPADLILIARQVIDLATLGEMGSLGKAVGESSGEGDAAKAFTEFMASQKGKDFFGLVERVIRAGSVDPVFGTDPALGPVVSDLPIVDQMTLFTAILELSGFSKEAAETIRPS